MHTKRRRLHVETLEYRTVLSAASAQGLLGEAVLPLYLDVNRDGGVTGSDALQIINHINSPQHESWREEFDINRDRHVTPLDALLVLNHLHYEEEDGPTRDSSRQRLSGADPSVMAYAANVLDGYYGSEAHHGDGSPDQLPHPLGVRQQELLQRGLEAKLRGKAYGKVHEVARGQYVELEREGVDNVFVMLGEFGDQIHPITGGTSGPAHNEIPEPDRAVDNTTIWQADYDKAHYEDMYFNQMADYYETQSSGRYSIQGEVQDWVEVPFNAARYGTNLCGSIVCSTVWDFLAHTADGWYQEQLDSGKTPAEINAQVQQFDTHDRYDYDGDGNFDEPDGYIDHFQIVHAGAGEETGGGAQGEDAIWSHRWYAFFNLIGSAGPDGLAQFGGIQIGDSNVWIGDYTIQPENGGLGVFAHEFAHDLGLPDQYDTTFSADNGTGFWTIMSRGGYLNEGGEDIGSKPGDFNAWEKLQLGWLNYEVAYAGQHSTHKLGPAETNTKQAQALITVLPDRERVLEILPPIIEGEQAWYSGSGDNLDRQMISSEFTVPTDPAEARVTAKLWYDIELDWDYAYFRISADGGASWQNLAGNVTTDANPNGQNFGDGITGDSNGWVDAQFDLSAYAGQSVVLGLRYWTDAFVVEPGILVDDLRVDGAFASDAEPGDETNWQLIEWTAVTGDQSQTVHSFNAYIAEYRQYRDYDATLETGPYNFSFIDRPNWVEHLPYQDGLLISYWDAFHIDNNTTTHPGEGLILPIDAHPEPLMTPAGTPWRASVQVYDATFGLEPTDELTLHYADRANGIQYGPTTYASLPGESVFDDRNSYWSPLTPFSSVDVPTTGTQIIIRSVSAKGGFMQVDVRPASMGG